MEIFCVESFRVGILHGDIFFARGSYRVWIFLCVCMSVRIFLCSVFE